MFAFFAMGFVDMVGIATNYVKSDFALSDTVANLCTTMVFFWFFIVSIPTGLLMNKIGRKKTVLVSLVVTAIALAIPVVAYNAPVMILSFCLLGVGNAIMQVSLNPLVSNIVSGEKLASTLTFGQFVKAIASFVAPLIASWGAVKMGSWRVMFPIFMGISVLATLFLYLADVTEKASDEVSSSGFKDCFSLLGRGAVLLSFIGIICHVGIDVGTNVSAPKLLMERCGMSLDSAAIATSIYFLFRTIGCFSGSIILAKWSQKKFFIISVLCMAAAMAGLCVASSSMTIYLCVALIGFGNSNIFPIIFSGALLSIPEKENAVSSLMIAGLIGGAVIPPLMGLCSDLMSSQMGFVIVSSVCVLYLALFSTHIKSSK